MILKYSIISALVLFLVTSSDPYFGFELSSRLRSTDSDNYIELPFYSQASVSSFLSDSDDRINPDFKINQFYYPNVKFWFLIYTHLESTQVVIHDRENLSLIFKVLDFSPLMKNGVDRNTLGILQQKLSKDRIEEIKNDMDILARDPHSNDPQSKEILRALRNANIHPPRDLKERATFFKDLKRNLRVQTGQKNFIEDGLKRSIPYQGFITSVLETKGLPKELMAIPFLESSFNPKAHSRVSALGVWQFMPLIGSFYLPKRTADVDYRSNVALSSIAASHMLSENFRILKRWDLTVTSYNSGIRHLLKSKRELASDNDVSLEDIIRHSSSENFGFASKNFFAEFLALAHVIAYEEEIFPNLHSTDRKDALEPLRFYLSKCSLKLNKELSADLLDEVLYYNNQLREFTKPIPKGSIISLKSRLPTSKFFEIDEKRITKTKPIDWPKVVSNQSCSTR